MKRLILIKRDDATLDLQYVTTGRFGSPTEKGKRELGDYRKWYAIDCISKDDLLKVCQDSIHI